ncbi:MAG: (d)CMP kinase [Lachnospiraceae bacterium]|nr:(d)CMP kinase [Lachnospiraceae bacterium]
MMASIAIDGPAGAGKSTIAKLVAKELNAIYVDTGAMYRAIAIYFLRHELNPDIPEQVENACRNIEVSISYEDGVQQVWLNGENVTPLLRTEAVGNMASKSSAKQPVREKLLQLQRDMAVKYKVVMDGRDIGTNVLPNAEVKIYLTASSAERARRRYEELKQKGEDCNIEEIERDIIERDRQDMSRAIAPLKQAEDAYYLDSSSLTIPEVVAEILKKCEDAAIWK